MKGTRKMEETNEHNVLVENLQELTRHMARAVVGNPDGVQIEVIEGASMIVLELSVDLDDMGRVIGKRGQVANAMRTILRSCAARHHRRVNLEIIQS
jgi:predicted RNA-binding protein YlqC (UPF0109 family)